MFPPVMREQLKNVGLNLKRINKKIVLCLHYSLLSDLNGVGKLCDVSARYERAIQEEPDEIGHHKVRIEFAEAGINSLSSVSKTSSVSGQLQRIVDTVIFK